PTGKLPNGRGVAVNGNGCTAPLRRHSSVISGSRLDANIGATPSARLGACCVVGFDGACVRVTFAAGTVLVNVRPNSTTTMNGRCDDPSGVALSPFDGNDPNEVTTACASADPSLAASRYLPMNAEAGSGFFSALSAPPNLTVSSIGPTSKVAVPWKSGPDTSMRAPRLIEIVISPKM